MGTLSGGSNLGDGFPVQARARAGETVTTGDNRNPTTFLPPYKGPSSTSIRRAMVGRMVGRTTTPIQFLMFCNALKASHGGHPVRQFADY